MIKIKLSVLLSALIIAPKNDVRYYLNGINISVDCVVATDGHRLFKYDLKGSYEKDGDNEFADEGDEFESFIIPRESITQISKSLTAKERKEAIVEITKVDDKYHLICGSTAVYFDPIDGKYPDHKRVIPKDYDVKPHGSYNWSYMADFQKISKLLGNKFGTARLLPNDFNSALVLLPDDNATCVIMPMRE